MNINGLSGSINPYASNYSNPVNNSGSLAGSESVHGECQTCQNRRYQDQSDDSSVSMQAPTKLSPAQAEVQVRAHELQHVSHEKGKAAQEDRKVISQTVSIHYDICPECGRRYVSGGTTTTRTMAKSDQTPPNVNLPKPGDKIDVEG